jgi:membrane-bound lytic murein transglycosylase MltF
VMQVIPKYAAAPPINMKDVSTADKNIEAGVKMLRNITDTYFNDPAISQVDKTLFTFASYNAGPNRIAGLRKKAAQDGLDPNKWFGNVELEAYAQRIGGLQRMPALDLSSTAGTSPHFDVKAADDGPPHDILAIT